MKKIFEKHGVLRCIGFLMDIIAFILFIIAIFINGETPDMILKTIGLVLFVVGGMFIALTSLDHRLAKSLLVFVLTSIIMTWLIPYGYFQGTEFYSYEMTRIGIVDISFMIYYAINFTMDKIVYLFLVAGFYGVLSKCSSYQKLVENLCKKLKGHAIITSVIISVILFVFTSLFSQTFVVILFIPFLISILIKMNLDKLTTFAVTFGSALVGVLGCTYGTDSLTAFNYYLGQEVSLSLGNRFIIAAIALVLYNFFIVMRIRKIEKNTKKNEKNNEITDDPFAVEISKEKKNTIPIIIIFVLMTIITILGYIAWDTNFKLGIFSDFHTWLTGLEATEDFNIISYILGTNAKAFGEFQYVFSGGIVILLASFLISFLDKMTINEYIENFYNGTKKMLKPVLFMVSTYLIFSVCYLSTVIPSLVNWLANLVKGFNPFITSVLALITSIFQTDFGYTAYTIGGLLTGAFADDLGLAHTIFTSLYGLVGMVLPTGTMLVLGLSLMKIDYKDWLKYIWLFAVGMLVILLIFFTVVAYVI